MSNDEIKNKSTDELIKEIENDPFFQSLVGPFKELQAKIEAAEAEFKLEHPVQAACDHGVSFDEEEYKKHPNMSAYAVRKRWPRGWGPCPKGCGFEGIAYASTMHYIAGDW